MGSGEETHNKQKQLCTHTMSDEVRAVRKNKTGFQRKGTTCMGEVIKGIQ